MNIYRKSTLAVFFTLFFCINSSHAQMFSKEKVIKHRNCQIYLVTGTGVSDYGPMYFELLQKKNYIPVVMDNNDIKKVAQENDLAFSLNARPDSGKIFNNCKATVAIQKIINVRECAEARNALEELVEGARRIVKHDFNIASLATTSGSEISIGSTVNCTSAVKAAIKKLPKCEIQ